MLLLNLFQADVLVGKETDLLAISSDKRKVHCVLVDEVFHNVILRITSAYTNIGSIPRPSSYRSITCDHIPLARACYLLRTANRF